MSKRKQIVATFLALVMVLLVSCTPKAASTSAPQAPARPAASAPAPALSPVTSAQPAWQIEWDKTVEAAKKEGVVTLFTSVGPLTRTVVAEALQSRFDIRSEWVAGGGAELTAKIKAERRAKIYSVDATLYGTKTPLVDLKPSGMLLSLDEILFLPDLTESQEIQKVWVGGGLNWADKEHTGLNFASPVSVSVVVNTQLVQPGEIKSFRDLLNPKWRGKIVLMDPTVAVGPGATLMYVLGDYIMGWDFVRQMAEQEPALTPDGRMQITWLAQKKYAIALGVRVEAVKEFMELGVPLKILLMEEGGYISSGASGICALKNAPHPNAAKLFINWLLSKEGQIIYAQSRGAPSSRLDISVKGVLPEMIPDPKTKYVTSDSEEFALGVPEAQKKIKEIFGKLR